MQTDPSTFGMADAIVLTIGLALPALALFGNLLWRIARGRRRRACVDALTDLATNHFLSAACTRCNETVMQLLDVSPQSRSIYYACQHCGKKSRASACSDAAARARAVLTELGSLTAQTPELLFHTVALPLPHEAPQRGPISEAVRAEVWRRDVGRCAQCHTKQRLQFDHIIPVSKGGSSSAANLQILCEACNRSKAAKI